MPPSPAPPGNFLPALPTPATAASLVKTRASNALDTLPPLPDSQQVESGLDQGRVFLLSLLIAPLLALAAHQGLTHLMESGKILRWLGYLDKRLLPLNRWLAQLEERGSSDFFQRLTGRMPADQVAEHAIKAPVQGVLAWAERHLSKVQYQLWQQQLGDLKRFEEVSPVIDELLDHLPEKQRRNGPRQVLNGLRKRLLEGVFPRYWQPYQTTQAAVRKGQLQPVGRILFSAFQVLRQLFSGEFAYAVLGQKPGLNTVLLNGLFTIGLPIGTLLSTDKDNRLKRFSEDSLGLAAGNFVGWYWGTQLLGHGEWITRWLNRLSPGLATRPLLGGTWAGVLTEVMAIFALGRLFESGGRRLSHLVMGKPSVPYEPKLPPNYKPLLDHRSYFADPSSNEVLGSSMLTTLSREDMNNLMRNPNQVRERHNTRHIDATWPVPYYDLSG